MNLIETNQNKFQFKFHAQDRAQFDKILARVKAIPAIRWSPGNKLWEVALSASSALECLDVAHNYSFTITDETRRTIESLAGSAKQMLALSMGEQEVTENFGMNKELRPYQKAAVKYGIMAGSHINGDSPGMGKTPVAIAIVDCQKLYPVLVITIKRAKIHWLREWQAWTDQRSISVWTSETRGNAQVDIIHYDMAAKVGDYIINYRKYKCIILDEIHKCKGSETARTKAIEQIVKGIPIKIGLSGTVVVNNMKDLAMELKIIDRINLFGSVFKFLSQFTNAVQKEIYIKEGRKLKIWEYSGVKNEKQLYTTLRANCFIGRKKREVMHDLPPISEEFVDIPADSEEYKLMYERTRTAMEEASDRLRNVRREGSIEEKLILDEAEKNIFTLRRESGLAKLPNIKQWLFEWIDCGEKLIVFAHHTDVQQEIASWMPEITVALKAGQSEVEAQTAIDRFQKDEGCKIIVCSDMIASESITLTAASYMAICEPPMTDKDLEQMKGRFDRFGQQNAMTVYHLVDQQENSIDSMMLKLVEAKKQLGKINSVKFFIAQFTK